VLGTAVLHWNLMRSRECTLSCDVMQRRGPVHTVSEESGNPDCGL